MSTGISWTDDTPFYVTTERRWKSYRRADVTKPGQRLRRQMAALGLRWCRGCRAWLAIAVVDKRGVCRPCANAEYRAHYAANPGAIRSRVHARKRGVAPVPLEGAEVIMDRFGGVCAYCPSPPTTWDHVVPVSAGGLTVPGNVVPACVSCNSSKGTSDVWDWLLATGRVPSDALLSTLALAAMPNAEVAA